MVMDKHPEWVARVLAADDLDAIARTVAAAERRTSGQIRVHLERRAAGDALARARRVFRTLRMERTRHRNGVLLFLALDNHTFAIVADRGIHERVGDAFWDSVRDVLEAELRAGRMREGIVAAVAEIGRVLATHFPDRPDDVNELSDSVSTAP
jgi:uncharacterized membrane protein